MLKIIQEHTEFKRAVFKLAITQVAKAVSAKSLKNIFQSHTLTWARMVTLQHTRSHTCMVTLRVLARMKKLPVHIIF